MAIDAVLVGTKTSGSGTTLTSGSGTTTASGSTFLIALSFDSGATQSNIRDSKSNTYTLTGTVLSDGGAKKALYRCENGTGGANHTASADFSSSSFGTIYLIEVTGALASSFDVTTQGVDTTSAYGVATGTLAQADEVVITLIGNYAGNNPMNYASSNMTELAEEGDGSTYWTSAVYKQVVSSTSSFLPSITSNAAGGTGHSTINATFKAASSTPGTINPTTGSITVNGRQGTINGFSSVAIREVLINEAGSVVGNRTGMHVLVWYAGNPAGAPDLSYSNLTTDPNGTASWSLPIGGLTFNQQIFYVATDGGASLSQFTCARLLPTYS